MAAASVPCAQESGQHETGSTSRSCKIDALLACNAPASDPRLVTGEVYEIVAVPVGCREREFVLPLSGCNYLIADGAPLPLTVTCPEFRREA